MNDFVYFLPGFVSGTLSPVVLHMTSTLEPVFFPDIFPHS